MDESSTRMGHVLEPANTWLKYLERTYWDRAIRIAPNELGG